MTWSKQQESIFGFFATGQGNLIVQALAGTGKTTTIKEAFNHAPEKRILYAVFNKRNQKEAEEKIKNPCVEVRTLHSLGYSFIKQVWSNAKPDGDVEYDRIRYVLEQELHIEVQGNQKEVFGLLQKLISFAKNTRINPTLEDLREIAQFQQIDFESYGFDCFQVALGAIARARQRDAAGRISFDDMVWLPVVMDWVKPIYDLVCVDEAQDMNLPQLTMARQASKGRVIVVGDSRQAIYGFRGAVQNAMSMMKVTLRAQELGLTTTYRCPKAVVNIAREIVPDFSAHDTAPDGLVNTINDAKFAEVVRVGDAVLSRLNAPLMPIALSLLRRKIPARIEGRDIGAQLAGIVQSMRAKDVPHFIEKLREWESKQIEKLSRAKNAEKRIEQVRDICATLIALSEGCETAAEIQSRIKELFQDTGSDSRPAVVLSSVHKAKGLEWPNVFLLTSTFRRGKGIEEDNIFYVAVTRAQKALYFVGGNGVKVEPVTKLPIPTPKHPAESNQVTEVETYVNGNKSVGIEGDIAYGALDGSIPRSVGLVFMRSGNEYVCIKLGHASATLRCLARMKKTVENKLTGESAEFFQSPNEIKVNTICSPEEVVRKMSDDELKNFLGGNARLSRIQQTTGNESIVNNMAKKVKSSKGSDTLAEIVALAKAGNSEAKILSEIKKHHELTPHITYVCGREFRRANKCLGRIGAKSADDINKNAAKAAKLSKKAPPARPTKKAPAKPAAKKSAPPAKRPAPKAPPMPVAQPAPVETPAPAEVEEPVAQ